MNSAERKHITGSAIVVRGNDIDTDRIIPARFLKCVVFEGLGEHAFADDRAQLKTQNKVHPFDDATYADATILCVNKNFGCGSSREHAPQAIMRWGKGIRAIVGESFAEIFFGNCLALGIPCLTLSAADIEALMGAVERDPHATVDVNLDTLKVGVVSQSWSATMPEAARVPLIKGTWDSTAELLAAKASIAITAAKLPYFQW